MEKLTEMKIHFLIFIFLVTALSANSQSERSKQFLEVFNALPVKIDCNINNVIQKRILFEYGAVYISKGAVLPKRCLFANETEVTEFINKSGSKLEFGDFYLQTHARRSLEYVFQELGGYENVARNWNYTTSHNKSKKKDINDDWAFRTYGQALYNWGYCSSDTYSCDGILKPSIIEEELKKDDEKKRPKMFSYAVPGGSQHHLGLAIDVNNPRNQQINGRFCGKKCESVLEKNGWYRTIPFDPYHFTYLGFLEFELPGRGLKKVSCDEFEYWVPNVDARIYPGYKYLKNAESGCKDVK